MKGKRTIVLATVSALALVALLLAATGAWAGPDERGPAVPSAPAAIVSDTISYQGQLLDSSGDPMDGTRTMTFRLYADPTGGTSLWSQTSSVAVDDGLFNVNLTVNPAHFDGRALWLGVQVQGDTQEMTPRQPLLPAPYALSLRPGAAISGALSGVPTLNIVSYGIGVQAETASTDPRDAAVVGDNSGSDRGVAGYSDGEAAVYGQSTDGPGGFFTSTHGPGVIAGSAEEHALVTDGPSLIQGPNPQQIALLRWYGVNDAGHTFALAGDPSGTGPTGVCFDGDYIWVASYKNDAVIKLEASAGEVIDIYALHPGAEPKALAFDGKFVWVANSGTGSVTRLAAADGTKSGPYAVGTNPQGIAFDGSSVWVTNYGSHDVTKLRPSDGSVLGTYPVRQNPWGVAFDGANIWVVNSGDGTVTKLAQDGINLGTYPVGADPRSIAFDGATVWVTNYGDDSVTRLRVSDGSVVDTYSIGGVGPPFGIAFDGANMWVTHPDSSVVTKHRVFDGQWLATVVSGPGAEGIAFDGANVWIANYNDDNISKR